MAESIGKTPVDKAVEKWKLKCEQRRAAELLRELYPPLAPDAGELAGTDEADDIGEIPEAKRQEE